MTRVNNDTRMLQLRHEAKQLTDEVVSIENTAEIPNASIALTKFLFSNPYLLFTDVNKYLESSDLIKVLMSSIEELQDPLKRDVLRLINLLLHVSNVMCDQVRHSAKFQNFMLKNLNKPECWGNRQKYKHHISIASQLLMCNDTGSCSFNTDSVRKFAFEAISDLVIQDIPDNDSIFSCVIFYACSMFTEDLEDIPISYTGELAPDKVLSKELTGRCLDIIRDYVQDFKMFYTKESEAERDHFILYKPKCEYSFQQICKTLLFFTSRSDLLRMNIFQSGIYFQINNLLSLKHIPEPLLLCGLNILKLPTLDDSVLRGVKNEFVKSINEKLNTFTERIGITEKTKTSIKQLLTIYAVQQNDSFDIPSDSAVKPPMRNEDPSLIHITNVGENEAQPAYGFGNWGCMDIQDWLSENSLNDLKESFPHLTGRGMKQLRLLANDKDKIKVINFLMEKIQISFETTLELIGALEKL